MFLGFNIKLIKSYINQQIKLYIYNGCYPSHRTTLVMGATMGATPVIGCYAWGATPVMGATPVKEPQGCSHRQIKV